MSKSKSDLRQGWVWRQQRERFCSLCLKNLKELLLSSHQKFNTPCSPCGVQHILSLRACQRPSSDSRSLLVGWWLLLAGFGLVAGWLAGWLVPAAEIATHVVGTSPTELVRRSSKQATRMPDCKTPRLQVCKEIKTASANDFKLSDEKICFLAWWPHTKGGKYSVIECALSSMRACM